MTGSDDASTAISCHRKAIFLMVVGTKGYHPAFATIAHRRGSAVCAEELVTNVSTQLKSGARKSTAEAAETVYLAIASNAGRANAKMPLTKSNGFLVTALGFVRNATNTEA